MTFESLKNIGKAYARQVGVLTPDINVLVEIYINNILKRYYEKVPRLKNQLSFNTEIGTKTYDAFNIASGTTPKQVISTVKAFHYDGVEYTRNKITMKDMETTPYYHDQIYWALWNDKAYIHPTPSSVVAVKFDGSFYPVFATDTELLSVVDEDFDAIGAGLKYLIESNHGDLNKSLVFKTEFEKFLTRGAGGAREKIDRVVRLYEL